MQQNYQELRIRKRNIAVENTESHFNKTLRKVAKGRPVVL